MEHREHLKALLTATNGRFFKVIFRKKDNTLREMTGRFGVTKHLNGGRTYTTGTHLDSTTSHKPNLVTIFDTTANDYRCINLDTLEYFKCGDVEWNKG